MGLELTTTRLEDAAKWARDPGAQMQAAHDAGFRAVTLSALWEPGGAADAALPPLRRAVKAAVAKEIEPVLFVYQLSSNTPLDPAARSEFARFAATLARSFPRCER
jgi:hypothetical protein